MEVENSNFLDKLRVWGSSGVRLIRACLDERGMRLVVEVEEAETNRASM